MLVESIKAGLVELNTSEGRRMVKCGERVTVDDRLGQKLIEKGLAVAVEPGQPSPTARARYTGANHEVFVEVGSYRGRVPAGEVVDLPLYVVAELVDRDPGRWRREL